MKVVIVGGVAGGATAAARIRRLNENAQVVVFERSGYVSYANCGLPYYIGGAIRDEDDLTLQTPEGFWDRFRIDIRVRHEVTAIDPIRKTVTVYAMERNRTYEEPYDKLLLAPGAQANRPALPGIDEEGIFSLRTVEDTFRIAQSLTSHQPKSAVVVGGGYIGLEMAENLIGLGIDVTIVQRPKQLLTPIDYDMACQVHALLRRKGAHLQLGSVVTGFQRDGKTLLTLTRDHAPLRSDIVILAMGVSPDTALARKAGLALGAKEAIVVNQRMETSAPDIYAAGDAVEVTHFVSGKQVLIPLAGPANKQGRIAADNICGGDSLYRGSQASSVVKLFDMTIAVTGLNERGAAAFDYDKVILNPSSHATYYPGAKSMLMKVLFEKGSGKILGGQILGYGGVDKRIDVLASAIRAGMTAYDLTELDLAYAPPYSSAKDPVNMAGYLMENLLHHRVRQFHWDEVETLPRDGSVTLLDVRTKIEYDRGHIDGFRSLPLDDLREHLEGLDVALPVYVMCHSGLRSYLACRILSQNGYCCYNLSGGYAFWETAVMDRCTDSEGGYPCGVPKSC